jgi:hypothetical protein
MDAVGEDQEVLWERLQTHTEQLSTIDTGGQDISEGSHSDLRIWDIFENGQNL